MKNRSSFKEIQRFKEISEILGISFSAAQGLVRLVNEKSIDQRHQEIITEETAEAKDEA